jgi:hypothetical protein
VEASWVVNALLAALVVLWLQALVDAAEGRFIRLIRAVTALVAHLALRDALTTATLKLVISASSRVGLWTLELVTVVTAIILTIAPGEFFT